MMIKKKAMLFTVIAISMFSGCARGEDSSNTETRLGIQDSRMKAVAEAMEYKLDNLDRYTEAINCYLRITDDSSITSELMQYSDIFDEQFITKVANSHEDIYEEDGFGEEITGEDLENYLEWLEEYNETLGGSLNESTVETETGSESAVETETYEYKSIIEDKNSLLASEDKAEVYRYIHKLEKEYNLVFTVTVLGNTEISEEYSSENSHENMVDDGTIRNANKSKVVIDATNTKFSITLNNKTITLSEEITQEINDYIAYSAIYEALEELVYEVESEANRLGLARDKNNDANNNYQKEDTNEGSIYSENETEENKLILAETFDWLDVTDDDTEEVMLEDAEDAVMYGEVANIDVYDHMLIVSVTSPYGRVYYKANLNESNKIIDMYLYR